MRRNAKVPTFADNGNVIAASEKKRRHEHGSLAGWFGSCWLVGAAGDGSAINIKKHGPLQASRNQFIYDELRLAINYIDRLTFSPEEPLQCLIIGPILWRLAANKVKFAQETR